MKLVTEYRLRNSLEELRQVGGWVDAFAQATGLSLPVQNALDLSLVEWITNIISYGYRDTAEHWITVRFQSGEGLVQIEVEDDGCVFNPLTRPRVDTTAPLESRPVGGLGIHLIRQLMSEVEYQRVNERNIVRMIKRLDPST